MFLHAAGAAGVGGAAVLRVLAVLAVLAALAVLAVLALLALLVLALLGAGGAGNAGGAGGRQRLAKQKMDWFRRFMFQEHPEDQSTDVLRSARVAQRSARTAPFARRVRQRAGIAKRRK